SEPGAVPKTTSCLWSNPIGSFPSSDRHIVSCSCLRTTVQSSGLSASLGDCVVDFAENFVALGLLGVKRKQPQAQAGGVPLAGPQLRHRLLADDQDRRFAVMFLALGVAHGNCDGLLRPSNPDLAHRADIRLAAPSAAARKLREVYVIEDL